MIYCDIYAIILILIHIILSIIIFIISTITRNYERIEFILTNTIKTTLVRAIENSSVPNLRDIAGQF